MYRIASYFIKNPTMTNLTLALIILLGIMSALTLQRQGYPAIDFDIITITTEYPGASPSDVEINVTDPIEDELLEVEDIDEIKSMSMENASLIFVYIDPDARDPKKVKSDIRDAVDRVADLPREIDEKPRVEEIRSVKLPVLELAVVGDVPEAELRTYAKALEDQLKDVDGVGSIEMVGYNKREIKIRADADKLKDSYVSLGEIMNAIRSRNVRVTGGSLESYVSEKNVVTFSEYEDPLDVSEVVIRTTFTGSGVKVSDVAKVENGFEKPKVLAHADGRRSISMVIRRQEDGDVIDLSHRVSELLKDFRKGLPKGIEVIVTYDNSHYTARLLQVVTNNGLIGFVLIVLVLLFFLDWKTSIWTALGLVIAICGALIMFKPMGITMNYVALAAMILVIGILVDDAIVIAEKSYQFKEQGMESVEATIRGLRSVFWPVVAAVLTTAIAFVPMMFMKGITGKFVSLIPKVVIVMLIFSLLEATIFLPCHIAHIALPSKPSRRAHVVRIVQAWYRRTIEWCLVHRIKTFGAFLIAIIAVIIASWFFIRFELFPAGDVEIINIIVETPRGTSLQTTEKMLARVEEIVDEVVPDKDIKHHISRIGHHNNDTDILSLNSGQYENWAIVSVYLKPRQEREEHSSHLVDELERRFARLEGFDKIVVLTSTEGPPVGKPLTVTFASDDEELRSRFESELVEYLKNIDGVYDIETDNVMGKDELRLILDHPLMARLGITALEVARTVRAAFEGEVVTSIRRGGEEIDFRVSLANPEKYRAEGVLELLVTNKDGKLVPLKHFAHFDEAVSPAVIHHHKGRKAVTVTASVDAKKITSVQLNERVRSEFGPKVLKFANLKMELGGEEKKTEESLKSFIMALIIAVIGIYFLLVVLFRSFGQPLLIMSVIPLALIGVLVTFMVHGLPLGFMALIGILGLVGVVVNDTIVMVSHLNDRCRHEGKTVQVIAEGATSRFRQIVLTTVTTVAGLLPTAYGWGGDLPLVGSMVLAVAWGLIFATAISLVFIPLLYSTFVRVR